MIDIASIVQQLSGIQKAYPKEQLCCLIRVTVSLYAMRWQLNVAIQRIALRLTQNKWKPKEQNIISYNWAEHLVTSETKRQLTV